MLMIERSSVKFYSCSWIQSCFCFLLQLKNISPSMFSDVLLPKVALCVCSRVLLLVTSEESLQLKWKWCWRQFCWSALAVCPSRQMENYAVKFCSSISTHHLQPYKTTWAGGLQFRIDLFLFIYLLFYFFGPPKVVRVTTIDLWKSP